MRSDRPRKSLDSGYRVCPVDPHFNTAEHDS
jgi:hypothetical protein